MHFNQGVIRITQFNFSSIKLITVFVKYEIQSAIRIRAALVIDKVKNCILPYPRSFHTSLYLRCVYKHNHTCELDVDYVT
jgi:hypothetical protein